jgi:membrane protein implicated in regulation of membrane protease activity
MTMAEWIAGSGPWAWIILGVLLFGLELLAPGIFFVWLGIAAVLTGLADGMLGLSWQASALLFAVLCVLAVVAGRRLTGPYAREEASHLNQRGEALVGRTFTLDAPIARGEGRVRVDDSFWRVKGTDAPVGASVRVVRVEGTTLIVEGT